MAHVERKSRTQGRALADLAARQHGVVALRQLPALGWTPGAVRVALDAGRLHSLHRGVYAVGHRRLTTRGRWMAAVLACGPGALLSHRSAAALWGLIPAPDALPEVLVSTRPHHRPAVRLRYTRSVDFEDRAVRDGIAVTSVPRTLLSLAGTRRGQGLERAIAEAERLRLFDLDPVIELLERSRRRPGSRRLRNAIRSYEEPEMTRSELERRFLQLARSAGLPRPAVNASVAGHEVDMLWPRHRLIVELDGYEYHRTRAAFERDRRRDEDLKVAGYQVIRLTARRLAEEPAMAIGRLGALLVLSRRATSSRAARTRAYRARARSHHRTRWRGGRSAGR